MVQILEKGPSFSDELISTLGQGLKNYQGYQAQKNDEQLIGSLNNPNLSDIERIGIASKLSPERQQAFLPLYSDVLQTQNKQKVQQNEANIKQQQAQLEEMRANEEVLGTIDELSEKLVEGGTGFWNQFNTVFPKGREKRAYFDNLSVGIEKRLVEMVGKGTLSKERFKYIQGLLPKASDTDATNRGKLKALAKEFKGGVPAALEQEKKMAVKVDKAQKQAAKNGMTWIISPSGKQIEIPLSELEAALASGGQLP